MKMRALHFGLCIHWLRLHPYVLGREKGRIREDAGTVSNSEDGKSIGMWRHPKNYPTALSGPDLPWFTGFTDMSSEGKRVDGGSRLRAP